MKSGSGPRHCKQHFLGKKSLIHISGDEEQIDFMLQELKKSDVNFIDDEIGKIVLLPIKEII